MCMQKCPYIHTTKNVGNLAKILRRKSTGDRVLVIQEATY
jgi:hypothetical protein